MNNTKFLSSASLMALGYIFSAVVLMYISRIFGAQNYGQVAFVSSIISYFALLSQLGIPMYAQRLCATFSDKRGMERGKNKERPIVTEIFLIGLILALLSYSLLTFTVFSIPILSAYTSLFLVFGLGILVSPLQGGWFFRGIGDWGYLLKTNFIFCCFQLLLLFLFIKDENDLILYAFLSLIAPIGCSLCNLTRLPLSFENIKIRKLSFHVKASIRFFLMSCMVNIYTQLDTVMLGFMKSDLDVGYYSIASKIKAVLTAIGGVIWNVNLTFAVKCFQNKEHDSFEKLLLKGTRLITFLQVPVFVFSLFHADDFVYIVAGSSYSNSVPALLILLFAIPPIAISNILGGQALIPANLENKLLSCETAGTGVNLILNFALIPFYSLYGAALATVFAEIIVCGLTFYYVKKHLSMRILDIRYTIKISLLSVFSLLAAFAGTQLFKTMVSDNRLFLFSVSAAIFAAVFLGIWGLHRKTRFHIWLRFYLNSIKDLLLLKKAHCYCSCCHKSFHSFQKATYINHPELFNPHRYENRDQYVVCPYCGAIPRHRIIASWAENHIDELKGARILYFAPEYSMMRWMKKNKIPVTTADLFAAADLKLDITNISLEDESFDFIFCNHVLEHVNDYHKALSELRRILRHNGKLIISFPIDPKFNTVYEDTASSDMERIEKFGQHDHLRVFGNDSLDILSGAGFKVTEIDLANMPEFIKPVVGPADYDSNRIFVCKKQ
jgi:O-antigen/teichoic acid export membrane protein